MRFEKELQELLKDSLLITNHDEADRFTRRPVIDKIALEGDSEDEDGLADVVSNVLRRFPPKTDPKLVI